MVVDVEGRESRGWRLRCGCGEALCEKEVGGVMKIAFGALTEDPLLMKEAEGSNGMDSQGRSDMITFPPPQSLESFIRPKPVIGDLVVRFLRASVYASQG